MSVVLSVAIAVRSESPEDCVTAKDASVDCDNHCDEISTEMYPAQNNGGMQFHFLVNCCPE